MQINFNIEYRTQWGEELYATLTHGGSTTRIPLRTNDGTKWHGCFKGIMAEGDTVSYYYSVFFYGAEKSVQRVRLMERHTAHAPVLQFAFHRDIPPAGRRHTGTGTANIARQTDNKGILPVHPR